MSDNTSIYEITKKISNPEVLKGDMQEITELISRHFKQKYLHSLEVAVQQHHDHALKHPSNEIVLLNAFKPFLGSSGNMLNTLISAFQAMSTFNNIRSEFSLPQNYNTNTISDNSIHSDGIYDFDKECVGQSNSINTESIFEGTNSSILIIIAIAFLFFFQSKK